MLEMELLNDLLKEVRGKFIAGAEQRLSSLLSVIERLAQSPADLAALSDLKRHFHNLAGTGGAYGFPKLTTLGRVGERECEVLLAEKSFPGAEELEHWQSLLNTMREELALGKDLCQPLPEKVAALAEQPCENLVNEFGTTKTLTGGLINRPPLEQP